MENTLKKINIFVNVYKIDLSNLTKSAFNSKRLKITKLTF